MSEAVRGFVLLLSVLLWLPCLRRLLEGEMSTAEAGARYGAALLLAWGGCAAVAALLKAYAPEPVEEPAGPARTAPDDTRSARVERAKAEVLVERRAQPRDDTRSARVERAKAEVLVERRAQPRDDDAIAT